MTFWNFYFLSKLYLFSKGSISFFLLPNLLLFGAVVFVHAWIEERKAAKQAIIALRLLSPVLALAVLWHDTYWPPFLTSFSFVANPVTRPTMGYIASFAAGYWSPLSALALAAILAAVVVAKRFRLKLTLILAIGIVFAGARTLEARAPLSVEEAVTHFYSRQADPGSRITLAPPAQGSSPFDIVILHTCSMSWDDLKKSGLDQDPFLSEFDLLFTRFNTATSYSGPALLRLLRAECGQIGHSKLYERGHEECSLMSGLSRIGYKTYTVFNHEGGPTDQMAKEAVELAGAAPRLELSNPAVEYVSFDGAPIFGNFDLLSRWWKRRLSSGEPRAALYYDTMSLHVGVHEKRESAIWKSETAARYKRAVPRLFSDYSRFMDLLKASGRPVLVIMVPEHGAALFGNRIQGSDLRDIPLPQITTVPVGFKFIQGQNRLTEKTVRIDERASYTAIAYLIRDALRAGSWSKIREAWQESLKGIPTTEPFVAENANYRVAAYRGELYLQRGGEPWLRLDKDLYPESAVSGDR